VKSASYQESGISGAEERQSVDTSSPWWSIHAARYHFAAERLSGQSVLDIACGTGYGLPILQARARSVVGVEIQLDAAKVARGVIGDGPEAVIVADGRSLPFLDASFGVVTSFETIEHLEQREIFVSELRRVLGPEGLCIISTPNANYTMPVNGKPKNPFHIYEYAPEEFLAELRKHFAEVELLGQQLSSRFAISAFLDDQQRMPRTPRAQTRLLLWRILNKMPAIRDPISQALWGHTFYPTENDYDFCSSLMETAPVLVALCRVTPTA
jgi:SAM-dependent methyltransferase